MSRAAMGNEQWATGNSKTQNPASSQTCFYLSPFLIAHRSSLIAQGVSHGA